MKCNTQPYYTYTIIHEAQHEKEIPKNTENNKIDRHTVKQTRMHSFSSETLAAGTATIQMFSSAHK